MKHSGHRLLRRGVTLVELVVVVACIALIATVGVWWMGRVHEQTSERKLSSDLVTINNAVLMYYMSGGDLPTFASTAASSPGDAINILKRKATDASAKQLAGFTGQFIDQRLKPVMQTEAEAATTQKRILWNDTMKRFEIATSGGCGIKRVEMITDVAELAVPGGTEVRTGSMKLAASDPWVWDYTDRTAENDVGPTDVETNPTAGAALTSGGPSTLKPPTVLISPGNYPLLHYPMVVGLENPNDPAVSDIIYAIDDSGWKFYEGTPITLDPGETVIGFSQSKDTSHWKDSEKGAGTYTTTPEVLQLAFSGPLSVSYAQAGGAMMEGGPVIEPVSPGTITLTNGGAIPTSYESSSYFNVYWTTNGNDPRDPGAVGLQTAAAFSGGFPGQAVDLSLPNWGSQTSFPVQVVAKSEDPALLTDSTLAGHTIGIERIELQAPQLTSAMGTVAVTLVTSYGDMPAGAQIYYTTDGTDPGDDGNGNPVTGTEYTGPLPLGPVIGSEIKARVYGPSGYGHWFTPSLTGSLTVTAPPIGFSITITEGL